MVPASDLSLAPRSGDGLPRRLSLIDRRQSLHRLVQRPEERTADRDVPEMGVAQEGVQVLKRGQVAVGVVAGMGVERASLIGEQPSAGRPTFGVANSGILVR